MAGDHDVDPRRIVAVFGGTEATDETLAFAERLGREIAARGEILLTGGTGPCGRPPDVIKNRAIKGAAPSAWIGVERGAEAWNATAGCGFSIESPLGHRRNYLEARMCDAAIVLEGKSGTKSELASALSRGRPVALVGEFWRHTFEALRDTPADKLKELGASTVKKFRKEDSDAALGYHPDKLTEALDQLDHPLKIMWFDDQETAEVVVGAVLAEVPEGVELTNRFPDALDHAVATSYNEWLEATLTTPPDHPPPAA